MKALGISVGAVVMLVGLCWAAVGDTQYPVFTAPNFVTNMKLVGPNFAAINADLGKKDFESAKAHLVRTRELLAVTITYWRDRKQDEAIKILRETLTKMDELDTALSSDSVDSDAATAIAKQIGAGCGRCHGLYREQDPATKAFKFKNGLGQ